MHCTYYNEVGKVDPKNRRMYFCDVCSFSTPIIGRTPTPTSGWTDVSSRKRKQKASSPSSSSSDIDNSSVDDAAASAFSAAQVPAAASAFSRAQVPDDFPPLESNAGRSLNPARRKKRGYRMSDVDRILSGTNSTSSGKGWFLLLLI